MTKPIALSIKTLKEQIITAINDSLLPAAIVEPILNVIYIQITQAAQNEILQAEQQIVEREEEK